jgi:beta-lactamase class A
MKKVELKQMSLDDIVTLQPSDINNTYGNLWKAGPGTKLKVSELLKLSLAESDNTAYLALFRLLSKEEINGVYESLDIEINTESADGITYPIVSPKSYTSIFRSLYLASFVNQDSSSYILNILTNSIFKNTIEGGVPSNIDVAHKIGVFKKFDSKDDVYIDCGIVYVPYRPYILCVFVKNPDENVADQTIAFISKIIYDYISIVGK